MADYNSMKRLARTTIAVLLAAAWTTQVAHGQYTFVQDTVDAVGNWNDPAQWTGGAAGTYPDGADVTVLINAPTHGPTVSGNYNLSLPAGDTTVGRLTVDNSNFNDSYRSNFAAADINTTRLIFKSTSGPAMYTETVGTANGAANSQYQFLSKVDIQSDLLINQDNYANLNTGTTFSNLVSGASNLTLTKTGHGGIQFNYNPLPGAETAAQFAGQVVINQGGIRLISVNPLSNVAGLTVNSGGQLMLADNGPNSGNTDWNFANGAVLKLNGPGKATDVTSPLTVANADGALRIAVAQITSTNFNNPVELLSDSTINVSADASRTGVLTNLVTGAGGLTKSGPGTLILSNSGDNYLGDTKLASGGGTLSLSNPILANDRDVYLVTGTTLNLNFGAMDTIRALYVDGIAQPIGTYSNGTAGFSSLITGAGQLDVTSAGALAGDYNLDGKVNAADYVAWRINPAGHGGDPGGYLDWRAHFGTGAGVGTVTGGGPVPEPTTITMIMFGAVTCGVIGRRRR